MLRNTSLTDIFIIHLMRLELDVKSSPSKIPSDVRLIVVTIIPGWGLVSRWFMGVYKSGYRLSETHSLCLASYSYVLARSNVTVYRE